jgi:hypothetical protein
MRARGNAVVLPIGDDKPLDRLPSVPEPGEALSVPLEPMRGLAAYVCIAGVSPPPTRVPAPALAAAQDTAAEVTDGAKVVNSGVPTPDSTSRSPADAAEVQPVWKGETPVPRQSRGRVVWLVGWGIAAVLIAAAWWWASGKPRKEQA